MTYETRQLYEHELPAWFDHVAQVFASAGREYFMNHWYQDPWRFLPGIRVAVQDGRIVSTVRVFDRQIYLNGVPVSMGGIGEVSTDPNHRQRGLSGRLLVEALNLMHERHTALSVLFTGRHSHYARYGWATVPHTSVRLYGLQAGVDQAVAGDAGLTIRPVNYAQDLAGLAELYAAASAPLAGPVVRTGSYWWNWLRRPLSDTVVAEKSGRVVAYLCARRKDKTLRVEEAAAAPGDEAALLALLGHALQPGQAPPECVVVPEVLHRMLDLAARATKVEVETGQHTMIRVVDLIALAQALAPVWRERLQAAGWQGRVVLDCEVAACTLSAADGGLAVYPATPGEDRIRIAHADFVNLLFGRLRPEEVAERSALDAAFLQALFPPVIHTFWSADGF